MISIEEKLQSELQEIMTRMPAAAPAALLNDLEKDTAAALAWKEAYAVWSAEFDSKMNELKDELNK